MKTFSVCPTCNKQIPAVIIGDDRIKRLRKECPEHGRFSTVIWRGRDMPSLTPIVSASDAPPPCPNDCGLCNRHRQSTCCVVVELTKRCNLHCPICFANATPDASVNSELSADDWYERFCRLVADNRTFIQLSGGEPTLLANLPKIIENARRAGCENIQLNTNGLRLGTEPDYAQKLADAGLSFVFMQFDGLSDDVYTRLRGRPLLKEKLAAIDACDKANLGVTLVPTIAPGINDDQIGRILSFGMERSPAVRGVHYQPISYFGRYPIIPANKDRITLPEIIDAIEKQTDRLVRKQDLTFSTCDHPQCGFHGDFLILPDRLVALTDPSRNARKDEFRSAEQSTNSEADDATISTEALRSRKFVSRRWKRESQPQDSVNDAEASEPVSFDIFLANIKRRGFTVTAMAFQDRYTMTVDRLMRCSLHVLDHMNDKLIPFCSWYNR